MGILQYVSQGAEDAGDVLSLPPDSSLPFSYNPLGNHQELSKPSEFTVDQGSLIQSLSRFLNLPFLQYSTLYLEACAKREPFDRLNYLRWHHSTTTNTAELLLERQENYSCTFDSDKFWLLGGLNCASVLGIVGIGFGFCGGGRL